MTCDIDFMTSIALAKVMWPSVKLEEVINRYQHVLSRRRNTGHKTKPFDPTKKQGHNMPQLLALSTLLANRGPNEIAVSSCGLKLRCGSNQPCPGRVANHWPPNCLGGTVHSKAHAVHSKGVPVFEVSHLSDGSFFFSLMFVWRCTHWRNMSFAMQKLLPKYTNHGVFFVFVPRWLWALVH